MPYHGDSQYHAERITSKEFKAKLRHRFPSVRWYVTRLDSPYCNFIDVGWSEGDLDQATYEEFRQLCDEFTDGLDPMEDGVPLGRQAIHIQGERYQSKHDGKFYFSTYRSQRGKLSDPNVSTPSAL